MKKEKKEGGAFLERKRRENSPDQHGGNED